MENLRLASGKEYILAVGGFDADEEKGILEIKLVTNEMVEAVMETFSVADSIQELKVVNAGNVQNTITGFTERGNVFTRAENEVIERQIVDGEEQNTLGNTIAFKMYRPSIEADVERNRADIDYLMMMEGGDV